MKNIPILAVILLGFATTGCSTVPVSSAEARPVPPKRLYLNSATTCTSCGSVSITRDGGFMGAACLVSAVFDGKKVADLDPGEGVTFPASAGQHVLEAEPGFCAGSRIGVSVLVESGKHVTFRIGRDHTGSMMVVPSH